jgi:ATP-dependent DNA helicase RecG
MLTDSELDALMVDPESDRVERKASLSNSDRIREAICAFANDLPDYGLPGIVFVGVNDDGSCAHLAITDELLRTLADMRGDGNVLPFPVMTVQKKSLRGCEVAVLVVQPSDNPPVRYHGRTCIRVGPRRATATAEEERRLTEKRRAGDRPFDQRPVPGATINDLDLDLFCRDYLPAAVPPDLLDQNQRTTEQQLASMRFLTPDMATPTNAGILVLGQDPRQWIPGDYIQFLRFAGSDLTDPIKDQKEIDGPLPELLRLLDEVLTAHIGVATEITGQAVEIRHPDYPIEALRQLARNAVLHRTYETTNAPVRFYWFSDRIEIHNPGGPYGQVNRGNFGTPGVTDYRNPQIAEAMRALGYVQRFGVGIPIARRELQKNGNPLLEFSVEPTSVLATVRSRP